MEAESRVRGDLGPQVGACERFRDFSWEVIGTEPWTGSARAARPWPSG